MSISQSGFRRIAGSIMVKYAMDSESADSLAYDIVAKVSNPSSFSKVDEFPGLDDLGVEAGPVSDAIIYAIQAGNSFNEQGDDSSSFGKLSAMLQYGVVSKDDVLNVINNYSSKKYEDIPQHDA